MLMTKGTFVRWNARNKKRFIELGYTFTKMNVWFPVRVEHLAQYSDTPVDVICDYCLEEGITVRKKNSLWKQYSHYLKEREFVKKDCCDKCKYKKFRDVLIYKQHRGMLKKEDNGYWTFDENRRRELEKYILKYGTIYRMKDNPEGKKLHSNLVNKRGNPSPKSISTMAIGIAIKHNLDINLVAPRKSSDFYQDEFVFYEAIKKLMAKHNNVFPTSSIIMKELKVGYRVLEYHGGIYEIKRRLGLDNKEDLRDNSGFYNSSKYEVYVANYLFENKIPYKREQSPFPNMDYRSDFLIPIPGERELHVEVWGFEKDNLSTRGVEYNVTRLEKERLYEDYFEGKYISIEGPETFEKQNYRSIQESLFDIFSEYHNLPYKYIEKSKFIPSGLLSDEELFSKVMEISEDPEFLPNTTTLVNNGYRSIYFEIIRRHSTYEEFAEIFNMKTRFKPRGYWDEDKILESFLYMLREFGYILNRAEIQAKVYDDKLQELNKRISKIKFIDEKLKLFDYCVQNQILIPDREILWLIKVKQNIGRNIKNKVNEEQRARVADIIRVLNINEQTHLNKENIKKQNEIRQLAFSTFEYMLESYSQILSINDYKVARESDLLLNGTNIYKRLKRRGMSIIETKLDFFNHCIKNKIDLPSTEVIWINSIADGKTNNQVIPTIEESKYARKIQKLLQNSIG
ncbi:hypothetical protein LCM10_18590 [Rossellomorea aquimaris]|uniref:hypothetical protein n=1 Tax=Rossellomorea aquimaris TaxID=189382 RepID=UPI001CD76D7A|nr:hypothetical protein [Rossellomorea aquimaris]MCA1056975.1 hypothetical protein [Rossellomorea aquimaris]